MNIFETQKKALLRKKIEVYKNNVHNNGKFSLFDTKFANDFFSADLDYEQLKLHYNILLDWDKQCNLPYNVGISLDKLAEDNTVMIHRANFDLDTKSEGLVPNDTLSTIMNEGLKNYGHSNALGGSAFCVEPPSLTLTMTPLKGITGYVNLLASYNSNDAIIVAAFPKELVNPEGEIINNAKYDSVYDLSGTTPTVKKEFMVGAILKKSNSLDEFYTRNEIINSVDNTKSGNINR